MSGFMRKSHKWLGLICSVLLIISAVSGIILNHRKLVSPIDIPRSWLPAGYQYTNWNNASVRGSIALSPDSFLLYGGAGIWLTGPAHTRFTGFTQGLHAGADNQTVNSIVKTPGNDVFAVTTFNLYNLDSYQQWNDITQPAGISSRISDLALKGDILVVVTRSELFTSSPPYREFHRTELREATGGQEKHTLFRLLWLLHSGELFGLPGQLWVDMLGIILILLSVTGLIYTCCPPFIRKKKREGKEVGSLIRLLKQSLHWHNKLGAGLLLFLVVLVFSGMFLRPPLLIAIIRQHVGNIPGTVLNSSNPWHDKLRCLRYDPVQEEWLLYASGGFYRLASLDDAPEKLRKAPPVSVMGVTVWEQVDETGWLVGSFNGLFYWERELDMIVNCYTGQMVDGMQRRRPVSNHPVSGYAGVFPDKRVVFEYGKGAVIFDSEETGFAAMPEEVRQRPMSLWHCALELHVGRAYEPVTGPFSELFVFMFGTIMLFILLSGYVVYYKRHRKKGNNPVPGLDPSSVGTAFK